jgi:hypothetical protein
MSKGEEFSELVNKKCITTIWALQDMMLRKRYDERKKGQQLRPDRRESTRASMRGQGTTSKPTS